MQATLLRDTSPKANQGFKVRIERSGHRLTHCFAPFGSRSIVVGLPPLVVSLLCALLCDSVRSVPVSGLAPLPYRVSLVDARRRCLTGIDNDPCHGRRIW